MPSKNPRVAVEAALGRLRGVAACVTDRPVIATGRRPSPEPFHFLFASVGEPVPLRTRHDRTRLFLAMDLQYAVERSGAERESFHVRTTSYSYEIRDHQDREILTYHWHPSGVSPITHPHLHLPGRLPPLDLGGGGERAALGQMHLPTGPVTLADVVRLLIAEFGVVPRRPDWASRLDVAIGAVEI